MLDHQSNQERYRNERQRKEMNLAPEERQADAKALKESFKNRETSDILSEILDREDLQLEFSDKYILVSKYYALTLKEAVKQEEERYAKLIESTEDCEVSAEELRVYLRRLDIWHEQRLKGLRSGKEIGMEREEVIRLPTLEVLGKRDVEIGNQIQENEKAVRVMFDRLYRRFSRILKDQEDHTRKGSLRGGQGLIASLNNKRQKKTLENLIAEVLGNMEKINNELLLGWHKFMHHQVLAAAGKRHDSILVEDLEPEKVKDVFQKYVAKYKVLEDKLRPFAKDESDLQSGLESYRTSAKPKN